MDPAAVCQALVRPGLDQQAAQFSTDVCGLDSLPRWRDTHLDNDLLDFAKMLRSPAGHIVIAGAQVRHPGFPISLLALSHIKVMRLALKHHELIQRPVAPANITVAWIMEHEFLIEHKKVVARNQASEDDLPAINMKDWALTKDRIFTHFSGVYGQNGAPMAYLLRDNVAVPAHHLDPQINYNGDYVREMIQRAAHGTQHYNADNRNMCCLIRAMAGETAAFAYIMEFTCDGRAAWTRIISIYLGPQHTNNQATIYEGKLQNASYAGESNRFGFDKYMEIHKTAHARLQSLVPYGYNGMDEGTKIRHFLNGIKTDKVKTVIEIVRGNPTYETFEAVARRIKDAVVVMQPARMPRRQIADVQRDQPFADVEADMNVEDKYYKPKEWAKLSAAKKKGVLAKRAKRGGGGKKRQVSQVKKLSSKQMASLACRVSALQMQDTSATVDDSQVEDDHDADPDPKRCRSNRTHPATSRGSG